MKRDPYNNKQLWENWKKNNPKKIEGISLENSKILLEFLKDMEQGMNTTSRVKGPRQPITLINLQCHIAFFIKHFNKPIKKITKQDLHDLDTKVRNGKVLKSNGKRFKSFGNYIKDFKSFAGWLVRTGKIENNIAEDLSKKTDKPSWVYLGEKKIKQFFNTLAFDYKVLSFLMFDSGMRVTEAYSVKVEDFEDDFKKLTISDEASKTFGRTINLKICSEMVKEFVKLHKLGPADYIFIKKTPAFNKYLRENCKKQFGEGVSNPKSKGKYSEFTLYDIRHNASCYWLKRYNSNKGLMYRMGWKKEDMIYYYSEFLGMNDELTDEDMIISEDKDKIKQFEEIFKQQQKQISELQKYILFDKPLTKPQKVINV